MTPPDHGNAGHIASSQRPQTYSTLLGLSTPSNPVHVFALDYRGFGLSTGTPSEEGIITDAVSLVNYITAGPLRIATSRIVIMGQSFGTAVASAVAERFAFGSSNPKALQPAVKNAEAFAGVVLLAPFSSVANVINSYSLRGLTPPLLSPLMGYPRFQKWVLDQIIDGWDSAKRVARLTGVAVDDSDTAEEKYTDKGLDLTIIHAFDDADIPWYEGRAVWKAATGEGITGAPGKLMYNDAEDGNPSQVQVWENEISQKDGTKIVKKVRWERVRNGGMLRDVSPHVL